MMKRHITIVAAALLSLIFTGAAWAMQNADYCQMPSYVVQNVQPNILILLDNSGSMFNFAYVDTDINGNVTNDCSVNPCTGFDPTQTYYGYFNSNKWYQYSSNVFSADTNTNAATIGSSITNPNPASDWNGNFLNWLTMRRADIVRKALTGGNFTNDNNKNSFLVGIGVDYYGRGLYKQITSPLSISNYTPLSNNNISFQSSTVNQNSGSFNVVNNGGQCPGSSTCNYNVKVQVSPPIQGVLQTEVGARARIGLAIYGKPWNEPPNGGGNGDGANVIVNVSGQSLQSVVNQVNGTMPTSNTPLAEALFEVAGYFGQVSANFTQFSAGPGPNYTGGKYTVNANADPYNYGSGQASYPTCSKNYVLLITDGEPCEDGEVPSSILSYAATGNGGQARTPFLCTNTGSLSNGTFDGSCPARCSDGSIPPGGANCTTTAQCACPANTVAYPAETAFQSCGAGNTSAGLESVALWLHDGNPTGIGGAADDVRQMQPNKPGGINSITLYTVFAFGHGSTLLKYASINGGFGDKNSDYMPDGGADANDKSEWSSSGTGQPDTYFEASQGGDLETSLKNALSAMLKRASSGTAASVLASGQGSGASLVQAVFYPSRAFGNDVLNWTGAVHDFWYYVDPKFANSDILEDTTPAGQSLDYELTLTQDDIASFYFDQSAGRTKADRFLSKADGSTNGEDIPSPVYFEDLSNLWEAGLQLWNADPSTRTIYTDIFMNTPPSGCSALPNNMISFDTTNANCLQPYMNTAGITNGTTNVIQWTRGYDLTGYDLDNDGIDDYRSRTVDATGSGTYKVWKLGDILDSTPSIVSWMPLNQYNITYGDASYANYIATDSHTQSLHSDYLVNPDYADRGTIYAGGNDGMLHAFTLGKLTMINDPSHPNNKALILCKDGTFPPCNGGTQGPALGAERWAFIPEHVLPYLQYISGISTNALNAGPSYCHIYTVDLTPYVFDASVGVPSGCTDNYWNCQKSPDGSTWRTILIGGMRLGGASSSSTTCCSSTNDGSGCGNCVTTPTTDLNGNPIGYSEYFALDVTDENNPKLLWEFAPDSVNATGLGFATSGPAVVRINAANDPKGLTKNGRWFVVFGSGPTGPIGPFTTQNGSTTSDYQFMGYSNQDLKYFVFDLENGPGANNGNVTTIDTKIPNAFSGDLFNSTNDSDQDYQDEAIYGGYVNDEGTNTWNQGGIGRILTIDTSTGKESVDGQGNPSPAHWSYQNLVKDIGPVTSGVARLQNNITNQLWLYFGTGRDYYSYYTTQPVVDSSGFGSNGSVITPYDYMVGMNDPCYLNNKYLFDIGCITGNMTPGGTALPLTGTNNLALVCGSSSSPCNTTNLKGITIPSGDYGWFMDLDPAGITGPSGSYCYPEVAGDPAMVPASCLDCSNGCVPPTGCANVTCTTHTYGAERVITDPAADTTGAVYFVTTKPYYEACGIGGKSFLWAVGYNNGASLAGTMGGEGNVVLQSSTGSIQKFSLPAALTQQGGRRTSAIEGVPPTGNGIVRFTPPTPAMQMLHIREEK